MYERVLASRQPQRPRNAQRTDTFRCIHNSDEFVSRTGTRFPFVSFVFGPAQRLHGATYVVDLELRRAELDADGVVVDIALATEVLRTVLGELNLRNLDDDPTFKGQNTTTEFLARVVFDRLAAAIKAGDLGADALAIESMRVTLHESHVAAAAFDGRL